MSNIITHIFLPISLALIMLGIGLSATLSDFKALRKEKNAIFAGLTLQVLLLPAMTLIVIYLFDVKGEYAVALLLVATCPGGVTSNAITFIFSGVVALSIVLTLLSSLITPFSIPLFTQWSLTHFLGETTAQDFSLTKTIGKLFILSIVPLFVGQIIQKLFPKGSQYYSDSIRKYSSWWFLGLIIAMIATNFTLLVQVVQKMGGLIFLLAIISLQLGYWGGKLFKLAPKLRLTLAIEVGVQNAGVGLFIASTIIQNQTITMILIAYGILMQIPVFAFSWIYGYRIRQNKKTATITK